MKEYKTIREHYRLNVTEEIEGEVIIGFYHSNSGKVATVICGFNEGGLEHVSFALTNGKMPTWDELCEVKNFFWDEEEEVIQIFPKKSEYVNIKDNCMHLWARCDKKRMLEVKE